MQQTGGLYIPKNKQPEEDSTGADTDGLVHILWRNPDGNVYVPYLNFNDDKWVLNFNYVDNDNWNDNDRVVRVCNSLYASPAHSLPQ